MPLFRYATAVLVFACLASMPTRAHAAFIGPGSFSGAFTEYNQEEYFLLEILSPTLLDARTTSWLGGGFDPVLTLFDSTGNLLGDNDDEDPFGVFDSLLTRTLLPGTYSLALTQSPNFFETAFGRFGYAGTSCGETNDAGQLLAFAPCSDPFLGQSGSWAVQIALEPASVPEPGTLALIGLGVATCLRRRHTVRPPSVRTRRHR